MGGPPESSINTQNQLTQEQIGISQQQNKLQQKNYQRMLELQQPEIAKQTALASGDQTAITTAAAPVIMQASKGFQAAKDSIFTTIAPGAARDKALADLEVNKATTIAGTEAGLVNDASGKLANIGAGLGSFSLQELGAALSGVSGASSSNQSVMQVQEQAKASTMGLIGSLAGAVTSPFSFAFGGAKSPSDSRLKTNIEPMADMLEAITKIQIVNFDYITGIKDQSGVIAQQVLPIMPEVVYEQPNGMYLVDYSRIAMAAIKALQELAAKVESLEVELAAIQEQEPYIEAGNA